MLEKIPLDYYIFAGLLNFIASVSLAGVVLFKNPRSRTNRIFFFFAITVAGWALCYFLWLRAGDARTAEICLRTLMLFVIFIPTAFTHFVLAFLGADPATTRKVNLVNYSISIVLGLSVYTRFFAGDIGPFLVFPYWLNPKALFFFHTVHFFANTLYAHALMLRALRRASGIFRNQILYVFIGTAIGYLGGAINYLTWYRIPIPPFLNPLVSVYVASVSYAVVKYRLMDINLAVTRTAVFAGVYVLLLGVPLLAALVWQPQLEQVLGTRWWVWLLITYAALATAAHYANQYFQRRAEDRLLAEQRRYQQLLVVAAEEMLKILDLRKLLRRIVGIIVKHVKLTFGAIYLQEREDEPYQLQVSRGQQVELPASFGADDALVHYLWASEGPVVAEELKRSVQGGQERRLSKLSDRLTRMNASVIVPAFLKTRLIGFMILGGKTSGQMFTQDDLSTFGALAHQAAIAIQNAHFHRRGVSLGQMATGHEQLAAWGHEMGNVLHIGTIQVGTLIASLPESLATFPKEQLVGRLKGVEKVLLRGHDVIDDVKAFLRCTEQTGIHSFPLAQFLQEAVQKLRDRFEDCPNIKVAINLPDNLPAVEGLATLSLLPLNLLAIPFWGLSAVPTGGTITVKALTDAQHSHVELVVSDDVTDSLRKHVEDTARPGEESLFPTRSRHGAFYYFAAKKTVADHGGKLVVLDGAGGQKGTTILVRLPVQYTPPKPEESEEGAFGDAA